MKDTSPEVSKIVLERIMAMTGEERLLMGFRMCRAARRMVLASFPPGLTEDERRRMLYERYYGEPMPEAMRAWSEERAVAAREDLLEETNSR